MPENETPPVGEPIYDPPPVPDTEQPDRITPEQGQPREDEHVVITPQTAGSAGAAHKES